MKRNHPNNDYEPLNKRIKTLNTQPSEEINKIFAEFEKFKAANKKDFATDSTDIHFAAAFGNIELLSYLMQGEEKSFNTGEITEIAGAATVNSDTLQEIEPAQNYNIINSQGNTPLDIALDYGCLEAVKFLLIKFKLSCNQDNVKYNSLLFFALNEKDLELVQYLVKNNLTNCNTMNFNDCPPLVAAAWKGDLEIVKCLVIEGKANCNVKDEEDQSPLFEALVHGHFEIAKFLIGLTEDFTGSECFDKNILDLIIQSNDKELLELALKFGVPLLQWKEGSSAVLNQNQELSNLVFQAQVADACFFREFNFFLCVVGKFVLPEDYSILTERYKVLLKKHKFYYTPEAALSFIDWTKLPIGVKECLKTEVKIIEAEVERAKEFIKDFQSGFASEMLFICKQLPLMPLKDFVKLFKETSAELNPEMAEIVNYYIQLDNRLICIKEFFKAPDNFTQFDNMIKTIDSVNEKIIVEHLMPFLYHEPEAIAKLKELQNLEITVTLKEKIKSAINEYNHFTSNGIIELQKNKIACQQDQIQSMQQKLEEQDSKIANQQDQIQSMQQGLEEYKSIIAQIMEKIGIDVVPISNANNVLPLIGNNDGINNDHPEDLL